MDNCSWAFPGTCAVCGKAFYMPTKETWTYKHPVGRGMMYFCKWSCMRAWEREHIPPRKELKYEY